MPFEFPPIDVWLLWTGNCPSELPVHEVSVEEESRAARYRIPEKSRQFLLGRLLGRQIVASQWGCSPRDLLWPTSGVPRVTLPSGERPGTISLSHSENFLAIALAPIEFRLGVDIESVANSPLARAREDAISSELELEPVEGLDPEYFRNEMRRTFSLAEAEFKTQEVDSPFDFLQSSFHGDSRVDFIQWLMSRYSDQQDDVVSARSASNTFFLQRNAAIAPAEWCVQLTSFPTAEFIGSVAIAPRDVATIPEDSHWKWDWSLTPSDAIPDELRTELGIWGAEFRRLQFRLTPAG
ncbi:4'-phosphopantetheinyl transferase family protein [Planctomicrobium piriforme]|uniref:4'-phosphopantetheinyl transferase superfamily protein n=1 Tax=Planctomicrobium piriforme TaxID=1576369 RepID=A0A1I3DBP4_9PLAN|nr:hypothetical protein [Planctomicrobium piriforme]SFH84154.1 hypothetical protein SAMN05421753_103171 [Planctomicrobium piriforme]